MNSLDYKSQGNILIVDDLPDNIRLLSDILQEEGYEVKGVVNGSMALNVANSGWPELILLDINMPEMNGYQTCAKLQANENTKPIPIIFLSALDDVFDKVKAFQVGGVDYITKPFQIEEVLARVKTHLQLRRLQKNLEREVAARTAQLSVALQEANAANTAKSNFLANMSHELRTPLNAVIGYSEILKEEAIDLEQEDIFVPDLDKISRAASGLLGIINNVLSFSKIERGKMELSLKATEVKSIVKKVVSKTKPLVYKNSNTLVVNLPESELTICADIDKVKHILFNILDNANKFTRKGIIILTVYAHHKDNQDWVCFEISDTGIGIAPEEQEKLFKPFSQVDDSSTRKYGGIGLGLLLAQKFSRMMGGSISVDSEIDRGSTFTIELPAQVELPR